MSARPALVLVAAVARNGVIGSGNKLLWRLSTDLRHFKARTLGKPLIMGRKTFESLGKPLPGRETIVVTRDPTFAFPGVFAAHGIDEALAVALDRAKALGASEVIVAGGGDIYSQAIGRADRLAITEVDLAPRGEITFPAIDPALWREDKREACAPGPADEARFSFVEYVRR